jgi:hypothetical protein
VSPACERCPRNADLIKIEELEAAGEPCSACIPRMTQHLVGDWTGQEWGTRRVKRIGAF